MIRDLHLTLQKLPPRSNIVYRGRTIAHVIAMNLEGPKIAPTTIAKWMGHISSMFIPGERLGWATGTPLVEKPVRWEALRDARTSSMNEPRSSSSRVLRVVTRVGFAPGNMQDAACKPESISPGTGLD